MHSFVIIETIIPCCTHLAITNKMSKCCFKLRQPTSLLIDPSSPNGSPVAQVAWIKSENQGILSINERVISDTERLSVVRNDVNTWTMTLRGVRRADSGSYMCQVNTAPVRVQVSRQANSGHRCAKTISFLCSLPFSWTAKTREKCMRVERLLWMRCWYYTLLLTHSFCYGYLIQMLRMLTLLRSCWFIFHI